MAEHAAFTAIFKNKETKKIEETEKRRAAAAEKRLAAAAAKAGALLKKPSSGGDGDCAGVMLKKPSSGGGNGPSFSCEWSREQVLVRTGNKGDPSTAFKFGDHGGVDGAAKTAKARVAMLSKEGQTEIQL